MYGYTGEVTDATGLVHLRARYYAPTQGRFIQRDTWGGDSERPRSHNAWLYAEGNPIRYIDPTGHIIIEQSILNGEAEFSCKCGWIDWNHVRHSDEIGYGILDDLRYIEHSPGPVNGLWAVQIRINISFLDVFNKFAVVPKGNVTGLVSHLAVSMFMDANEQFEMNQLAWGRMTGIERLRTSYFSEEDLPSDIMGFYAGYKRFYAPGLRSEDVYNNIRRMCGAVGLQESLSVFQTAYKNGNASVFGWKHWRPRLVPITGCDAGLCAGPRAWPSEFTALTSLRIHPRLNGVWWWGGSDYAILPTERMRVFRMEDVSFQRPPTPSP